MRDGGAPRRTCSSSTPAAPRKRASSAASVWRNCPGQRAMAAKTPSAPSATAWDCGAAQHAQHAQHAHHAQHTVRGGVIGAVKSPGCEAFGGGSGVAGGVVDRGQTHLRGEGVEERRQQPRQRLQHLSRKHQRKCVPGTLPGWRARTQHLLARDTWIPRCKARTEARRGRRVGGRSSSKQHRVRTWPLARLSSSSTHRSASRRLASPGPPHADACCPVAARARGSKARAPARVCRGFRRCGTLGLARAGV